MPSGRLATISAPLVQNGLTSTIVDATASRARRARPQRSRPPDARSLQLVRRPAQPAAGLALPLVTVVDLPDLVDVVVDDGADLPTAMATEVGRQLRIAAAVPGARRRRRR